MVMEQLHAEGFPPHRLELEITESETLADPEKALPQAAFLEFIKTAAPFTPLEAASAE
jgi:EAL domain-containing protein (putative c-di-GMP-specific phosphodiesterase class I)